MQLQNDEHEHMQRKFIHNGTKNCDNFSNVFKLLKSY